VNVLGIWDGHDSGAALIQDGQLRFAINEERLTRRKLEICFPSRSIDACLAYAGLEADANGDGTPDCFAGSGTGKSTVAYARVTDAHTGTYAERMTVSGYKNGVRRFESVKDAGTCAIAVTSGRSYTLGLWYKSTAALQLSVSYRSSTGTWVSWVTSPSATASASWTQLTFRTPAIPTGATALSFGVTVSSNATVTLDDWSIALAP